MVCACAVYETPGYSFFESQSNRKRADYYYRAEIYLLDGGQNYDVMEFSKDELIQDVLEQYERHFQYLHAIQGVAREGRPLNERPALFDWRRQVT